MTVDEHTEPDFTNVNGAWSERDVVRIDGSDAASFLQGQISQDVAAMEVGASSWSLLLAPTGKMVAQIRLHRIGEEAFLADMATGWSEAVIARLNRFKIRVKCEITDVGPWPMLSVRGTHPPAEQGPPAGVIVVPAAGSSIGLVGYDVLPLDGSRANIVEPAGLVIDPDAVEHYRIVNGVPAMGLEIDDSVIPAELGAWFVEEAVSWTKGCYTGQELVARVDSRGSNTPRHLRGLDLSAPASPGDPVTVDGVDRGQVTSVFGERALALLHRSVSAGDVVTVGSSTTPSAVIELVDSP